MATFFQFTGAHQDTGGIIVDEKTATLSTGADTTSLLYSALPSLIQRRVPRIRSLRHTASNYGKGHQRFASETSTSSTSPPPSYRSRPSSSALEDTDTDDADIFRSLPASSNVSRPSSSGSTTPTYVEETSSGVRWKYANQGYNLLALSNQEATSPSHSPQFSRKLYVDSMAYLLRGLPSDLHAEEQLSLRAALPGCLSPPTPEDNQVILHSTSGPVEQQSTSSSADPSLLHRLTASMVLYAFLAINFLLPYIQLLARRAYQFDRKHHISDRLLHQAVVSADNMGRQTVALANTVCGMHDGLVGEKMREVGVWWVQGVSGGIYEGFGEGMEVLGLKAAQAQRQGRPQGKVVEDKSSLG